MTRGLNLLVALTGLTVGCAPARSSRLTFLDECSVANRPDDDAPASCARLATDAEFWLCEMKETFDEPTLGSAGDVYRVFRASGRGVWMLRISDKGELTVKVAEEFDECGGRAMWVWSGETTPKAFEGFHASMLASEFWQSESFVALDVRKQTTGGSVAVEAVVDGRRHWILLRSSAERERLWRAIDTASERLMAYVPN